MDVGIAGVGLMLLSPLMILVAAAVKMTSRGPVLYRLRWRGRNGRRVVGYKFRTMVAEADQMKESLLHKNEMSGPVFKLSVDPRVTRLGRWLRKYSLDELPQLWCVLSGDLSLIGPRPPLDSEYVQYKLWHTRKMTVTPGISCLWQVRGRNAVSDFDKWIQLDLRYIDTWSLGLDLKLIVQTMLVVLRGTGR